MEEDITWKESVNTVVIPQIGQSNALSPLLLQVSICSTLKVPLNPPNDYVSPASSWDGDL